MKMLFELLLKNQTYQAQYRRGLANHMSMSLIALSKLQISDDKLESFFIKNCKKLEIMTEPKGLKITDRTLLQYLGKHENYADLVVFFSEQLSILGFEKMLKKYLSILLPGIAAGAFHGLLRTAYGLFIYEQEKEISEQEIVRGLAYWADTFLPLGFVDKEEKPESIPSIIEKLDYRKLQDVRAQLVKSGHHQHLIFEQMKFSVEQIKFNSQVKRTNYSSENLASIAAFSIALYNDTYDFTALHAVTATHAFRSLLPFILDKDDALNYFWRAIFASYLTVGAPCIEKLNRLDDVMAVQMSWEKIIDSARLSSDDHVVKFVYSCLEEYKHYHNPLYIKAAAVKAGLYQLVVYNPSQPHLFWKSSARCSIESSLESKCTVSTSTIKM